MAISASQLRQDVYRLLDQVLATGSPLEIGRGGRRLRIVADEPVSKLARIEGDPGALVGDPDDIVHIDWSAYWKP